MRNRGELVNILFVVPAKYLFIALTIMIVAGIGTFLILSGWTGIKSTKETENKLQSTLQSTQNDESSTLAATDSAGSRQNIEKPMQDQNTQGPTLMQFDPQKKYLATLSTTQGDITVELKPQMVPLTVSNFIELANKHFYDNTIFHRVIKGFMIQGGDPKGDGSGGPGYKFKDEPFEGDYKRGTIAMANAGPNTNGSQFFIMHQDSALPKNYTIFGEVVSGIEVVDKIAESPVTMSASGENSKPVTPVTVKTISIEEK